MIVATFLDYRNFPSHICAMKFLTNKWILLAILTLTWGSSFILIKQSIAVYTPMQVGSLRLVIAGLVLVFFGVQNFKHIPKKLLPWVIGGGCLGNFIPMFMFPYAQEKVSSSMAGILDSLVPMFILLFGYLFFKNKTNWKQILGTLVGFVGAIVLMNFKGEEGDSNLLYSGIIVLATAFYGLNGLIVSNKLTSIQSFRLSSVVFTIWLFPSLIILGLSGFFQEFEGTEEQWEGLGFVSILGLIGTALAMILYYKLIQQTSAIFASVVTYLMPIVAVMWGFLDGEVFTWTHVIGGLLILLGVYLIQMKTQQS